MCKSDYHHFGSHRPDPNQLFTTKAFYLRLKLSNSISINHYNNPLSESLTLLYLPRINGSPLEVNGSKIRPDSPAYVTLHRVVNADPGLAVFGSVERIRVGEGVRFEVYIGEDKLLTGIFRRQKDYGAGTGWRVDCTCELEREISGFCVEEAEVSVAVEGGVGRMRDKVEVAVEKRRRRRRHGGFDGLEEIPEEEEESAWEGEPLSSSSGYGWSESASEDLTAVEAAAMEHEMEGVRWAVDVGMWVVCIGVGYLVSRASVNTLRRRKIFL